MIRRFPIVSLDGPALQRLVRRWAPDAIIEQFEVLGGGGINTNYRIDLGGDRSRRIVLRIYQRDRDACLRELRLLELLDGVAPAPRVLHVETEPEELAHPFALLSWVEGMSLAESLRGAPAVHLPAMGRAAGEVLAAIGRVRFPRFGMLTTELGVVPWGTSDAQGGAGTIALIETYLSGHAGRHLGVDACARLRRMLGEHVELLDFGEDARLVHGDYSPENILMTQTAARGWRVSGVLDWEWAHAGTPLFDLAILTRNERLITTSVVQGVVDGYRAAGGDLPPRWRDRARLLDLINLLEMIDTPPALHDRQREMLGRIMETLEHFDG